ncbi:MAG TPA: Yip1 family protein [Bacteroidales bacterium]|nr:Yip1 family protein [Bacteroidales bacterium]
MSLLNHAVGIITKPKVEWEAIKNEPMTIAQVFTGYVAILALIPAIASFIGLSLVGVSIPGLISYTIKYPIVDGIINAVVSYIMAFVGVYVAAFIINALASNFESTPNMENAVKLVAFSYTPVWIVGIFSIYPVLGVLSILGLYGLYLLYLGLEPMMNTPATKKMAYLIVSIVVLIVVFLVVGLVVNLVTPKPSFSSYYEAPYNF